MIIEADNVQIPFSAVRSVRQGAPYPDRYGQKNVPRVIIEYGDGETASMAEHSWDRVKREMVTHMIPAQPGTFALFPHFEGGKLGVTKTPVIAWAAASDANIYPVTCDGVNDGVDDQSLPVLHPDGTVVLPGDRQFATFEAWEAEEERHARERAERRRAAAQSADDRKEVVQ